MSVEKSLHFLKNYVLSGIVAAALIIGSLIAIPYYSVNNLLLVQAQVPPSPSTTTGEMADIALGGTSTDGSVEVFVNWTVADIGQPNKFSFVFADPDGNPISPIYSIQLLQNSQTVPGTLRQEQTSPVQEYTFNQTGSYILHIHDMQDRRAIAMINIPLQVPPPGSPPTTTNSTSSNTTTTTSDNNPDTQFEEILGSGLSDDTRGEY
jgi:hypothetical protein